MSEEGKIVIGSGLGTDVNFCVVRNIPQDLKEENERLHNRIEELKKELEEVKGDVADLAWDLSGR